MTRYLSIGLIVACCCSLAQGKSLQDLYQQAVVSDPTLKVAEANYQASRASVFEAGSALLPQITYTDTDTETDTSFVGSTMTLNSDSRNKEFQGSMAIVDIASWNRLRSAKRSSAAQAAALDANNQELILRLTSTYLNALTAVQSIYVAEAEFKAVKRRLEVSQERFSAGLGDATEVHEARAQYDLVRVGLIRAQGAVDITREALIEIVGEPVDVLIPISNDFRAVMPQPLAREAWVEQALVQSPSLRAAEEQTKAARANKAAFMAAHMPVVRAVASKRDNTSYNFGLNRNLATESDTVGMTITVPLLSGGGDIARQRRASYQYEATRQREIAMRRGIIRQVRSYHQQVETALGNFEAMNQAVVSAASAHEATEVGYEAGTRNIVDVLSAERQLYAAQRNLIDAKHGFIVSVFQLRYATGNLAPAHLEALSKWQGDTPRMDPVEPEPQEDQEDQEGQMTTPSELAQNTL